MNFAGFVAAGYAPVPLRGGRPAVAGIFSNRPSWRASLSDDLPQFAGCDVGIICSARPLSGASGAATLGACASTWCAGIRYATTDSKLGASIADSIARIAGPGPIRFDGAETLHVFKVEAPFIGPRLAPVYFPREKHTAPSYQPHRFEVLSLSAFLTVSGGTWLHGELPQVRRDELPTLTSEHARAICSAVEQLWATRGALPWTI